MDVAFNPKDPNTFATASLDRTIKIWSLGSPKANYTLEGHEKGVNALGYYSGAEKPYLVSGSDDHTVRVWDYQNKACVRVLEGHTLNVSSVKFHPELPLILSGSEDCTLKVWNSNTFRLEASYSMSLERIWSLSNSLSSELAIGCDDGFLVLQLGKGEPTASMDGNGKVIWAHHHEILTSNLKTIPDLASSADGQRLMASSKELGQCELFPQSLQHSPNGRFVAVCGDGEYIVYTAVAWRNRAFGKGLDFAWSSSSNEYCVKDSPSHLTLFSNFNEVGSIRLVGQADRLFGGPLLAVSSSYGELCFYDWQSAVLLRRIDAEVTNLFWSEPTGHVAICTPESVYILKYRPEVTQSYLQQGIPIPEDGIEEAFEFLDELPERATSGVWVEGGCFVFANANGRVSYHVVGGQTTQLAIHDRVLFVLGYLAEENRIICTDKDVNFVAYSLATSVIAYESAILNGDYGRAASLISSIPAEHRNRVAHFLESQGSVQEAFDLATDQDYRFDLALRLGRLDVAYDLLATGTSASEHKWRSLGDKALAEWKFSLAEKCFWRGIDLTSLLLLYTASANASGLSRLAESALSEGQHNIAFTCYFSTGKSSQCFDLLMSTGEYADAALFARAHLPAKVDEAVGKWKEALMAPGQSAAHIDQLVAKALARPSSNPELFSVSSGAAPSVPAQHEAPSAPQASFPVEVPSGQSSRTRNVSFDKKIPIDEATLSTAYASFGSSSQAGDPSEHMSLEVNTTGTGSQRALTDDFDELASMRTFATAATAGQLDLDRLTIHDEMAEDLMMGDAGEFAGDDERNPKPTEELFSGPPASMFNPPPPSFHYKEESKDIEESNETEESKDERVGHKVSSADPEVDDEEQLIDAPAPVKSPLQNINYQPNDDDWL